MAEWIRVHVFDVSKFSAQWARLARVICLEPEFLTGGSGDVCVCVSSLPMPRGKPESRSEAGQKPYLTQEQDIAWQIFEAALCSASCDDFTSWIWLKVLFNVVGRRKL